MTRRGSHGRLSGTGAKAVIVVVCLLAIVGGSFYLLLQNASQPTQSIVEDWRLRITIHDARNGQNYTLPYGIGVIPQRWKDHTLDKYGPPNYAPLSTRDSNSTVYIQSTVGWPYKFGDFFNIWGTPFDSNCVPDGRDGIYCAGPGNNPPIMSDGGLDRCINRNLNLANGKDWVIIIGAQTNIGC